MKVSCIANTYRRFTCLNRSIRFFLNQDSNVEKELIIYNTDIEYPLELDDSLKDENIKIINNNTDLVTRQPYTNIGDIRRDSLQYADGSHYICWDDDDIFLPWHISQCVDGFNKNPDIWAWKPHTSMFWNRDGINLACNNMEASILVDLNKLKEIGFSNHQGGGEHLYWMDIFKKLNKFYIDKSSIPSYCFNWSDNSEIGGHKQSGSIRREDNFEFHKKNTKDHAKGKLTANVSVDEIIKKHILVIKENLDKPFSDRNSIKTETFEKYCAKYE
jgi:hypothetical protein